MPFSPKGRASKAIVSKRIALETGLEDVKFPLMPKGIFWIKTGSARQRKQFWFTVRQQNLLVTRVDSVGEALEYNGAGKPIGIAYDADGIPYGQTTAYEVAGLPAALDFLAAQDCVKSYGQAIQVRIPYMGAGACDASAEKAAKVKAATIRRQNGNLCAKAATHPLPL